MGWDDPKVVVSQPGELRPGHRFIQIPVAGTQLACIYRTPDGRIEVAYQREEFPTTLEVERLFREAADQVIAQLFRITARLTNGKLP